MAEIKAIKKRGQVAVSAVATLLVTVGLMFILGFWVYTKVSGKVALINGEYLNTTHYCLSGTANVSSADNCLTGTLTSLPIGYAAQNTALTDLKSNVNDGFVIGGISLLLIAVVAVISLIKSM